MDAGPTPSAPPGDARTTVAARAAMLVAYAVALVGSGAATWSLRAGDLAEATVVLTTSLGVAALLAATGTLLEGLRAVERRLRDVEDLLRGPNER